MPDLAVEEIGDGRQPDMRMRPDVERLVGAQDRRTHAVEEDERADQPALRGRQRAAHLEAADVLGVGDHHQLDGVAGKGVAWGRVVAGKKLIRKRSAARRSAGPTAREPSLPLPRGCVVGAVVSRNRATLAQRRLWPATALSNAGWLRCEGLVVPESLRTNCSAASRTSASVAGGSKLNSGLMFLHIPSSGRWSFETSDGRYLETPGAGINPQHMPVYFASSGSMPAGLPSRDSLIFSTLSSAAFSSRSQCAFSASPRS